MKPARRSVRHRRRIRATVGTTPVFTADVGPGGFSAELMRVQAPGTVVQGSIRLDGLDVPYDGEIAWAKAGAPHLSLRGRVGVRFTRLPEAARAVLGLQVVPGLG
jgi:PilZ domain